MTTMAGSVVVATLTYRRNELLADLLPQLLDQVGRCGAPAEVLVVDNDPAGGAREVVDKHPAVRYVHEPTPGIAAARNRAMDAAGDVEGLVFIDDDEKPVGDWLAQLLLTKARTGADAVVGWVDTSYVGTLDPWIEAGEFFVRRRHPTGATVPMAATNNLLLDLARVRALGLRFDPDFGLTGGSDTMFTRQLVRAGGRIVWCDEAVVIDPVPVDRATRRWVLRRRFRFGNGWARTSLALERGSTGRARVRCRLAADGLVRIAAGLAESAAGSAGRSLRHRAKGLGRAARGLGMVAGAFGHVYTEYDRKP